MNTETQPIQRTMKSEKKTYIVEKEYWTCWNPDHRHKAEYVANACIGIRPPDERPSNKKQLERNIDITRKIIDGESTTLIAAANNVSVSRCYGIFNKTLRDAYYKENKKRLYSWTISVESIRKDAHEWQKLIGKLV
jgi:hypothetical protein